MKEKTLAVLATLAGLALSAVTAFRVYAGSFDVADIVEKAMRLLQFL